MEKSLLVDLKKKVYIRSALLAIGSKSIDEILGLDDTFSADEILLEIFKHALREFEESNPLVLEMKLNKGQMGTCFGREGYYEIKSNFTLWLDCLISEDQIVLVPNGHPKWRIINSFPIPSAYTSFTDYQRPYVFLGDMPSDEQFIVKGLCSRPIIPDFLPDRTFNPVSQKAAVYWMNIEEGARGEHFVDLCLCHLLDYIRQTKSSTQLPGVSIDIFSNVDSAYQELRSRCDQYKLQSGWYGELME